MRFTITCNSKALLVSTVTICTLMTVYYLSANHYLVARTSNTRDWKLFNIPWVNSDREVIPGSPDLSQSQIGTATADVGGVNSDRELLLKPELKGSVVLSRSESGWSRDDKSCEGDKSFTRVTFHSPAGDTPMYVHPAREDQWVSGAVIGGRVWEAATVKKFHKYLKEHPNFQFIDIGANIGMYGLTIAKLGRKVIFVEPLLSNVRKLCNSVRDGKFRDAYVIHNAMSSRRFSVGFGSFKGNIGGTYVRNVTSKNEETAYAILLDDLLEIFNFSKVAMKIDVETHEPQVLLGGTKFFSKVDVLYLMLEWHGDKKDTGKTVIDFLTSHNMTPHHPNTEVVLDKNNYSKWPGDVLWKKYV